MGKVGQRRHQNQGIRSFTHACALPLTVLQLAAPKSKYIEHILVATHTGEAGVAEVFRALQNRLRDSTWTIVFKGLIVVHLMLREGQEDVTLKYLANSPQRKLAINNFTEGMFVRLLSETSLVSANFAS
jgi:hypothetical protein